MNILPHRCADCGRWSWSHVQITAGRYRIFLCRLCIRLGDYDSYMPSLRKFTEGGV